MDYKSVFTNLCLELQQNRSWIKGLGKNPFTHSMTAVLFVRGHRSVFPRTPRNTGVYTRHPTFVTATSDVLTRLPAKLSKNRMRVYTLSDMRSKKKLRVYTASEAKGLKPVYMCVNTTILYKNQEIKTNLWKLKLFHCDVYKKIVKQAFRLFECTPTWNLCLWKINKMYTIYFY